MALTVWAKDDAGDGGDVCLVEQDFGCFATVAADAARIGKRVERACRWIAWETEFVQSGQQQVTPSPVLVRDLFLSRGVDLERGNTRPLRRR